jgi:hypothetical protein
MKESMSITSRSPPGPAPADQARRIGLRQHPIKLPHMPEAERAQEGAERRGRHHAASKQRLGAPGPQHVAIVDRIGSERHRVHERADLAARLRGARALAEVDRLIDKPLEAQPVDQGARQQHSSVGNQALVGSRPAARWIEA